MNFFHTHISKKSIELVNQVLDSSMISAGKMADLFEHQLAEKLSITNPVTVNSGTSALHLALAVAGVGPGDEVILPAQTFIATGLVILMQGAKPVFADIDYLTGNIDPASIESKITSKTKAIIPVHWGGYPCDLDEINQIAIKYSLTVIEDAAHAIGATYKNKPIGSVSQFTVFSFQAIKHLTTGDGGALCCINKQDEKEAKKRRWFDIDRENTKTDYLGERVYDATSVGYKYHLNDIAAAIGIGNLNEFDLILKRHREIASNYKNDLAKVSGLRLLNYQEDRESAYWLFTILVERREDFIKALNMRGIPASIVHTGINKNSVFNSKELLPNQIKFNQDQVSIPIHAGLNNNDVEKIISQIKKGW